MSETGLIRAYTGLTKVLAPLLPFWLKRRALKGKEDPARQSERFGITAHDRPEGPLFWMHGASVGETIMLLPVMRCLLAEDPTAHVLITSGTVTSAAVLAAQLPNRAIHQYVPLDTPKAAAAFLDYWKPELAIWAESEIWPNLIMATHSRNIPMALINARMSQESIEGWAKRKKSARILFGYFDVILAGDEKTANSLTWLLGRTIEASGNLKDAAPPLPVNDNELTALKKSIGQRPVWCAASTHNGEEALILKAFDEVKTTHPQALLILAPRHPERRSAITPLLKGHTIALRSDKKKPTAKTDIYLFDTIGEMGLAYRLSAITFVGGSLVKGLKGHNPLEPARLGNAILTGTYIESFSDSYMSMFAFDAAQRILNPKMIGSVISNLLDDTDTLKSYQARAQDFAYGRDAVLDYVWNTLQPLIKSNR